ncbi:MAG: hypothetical protein IJA39_02340, partial [Clostridia bacterium]|nr:hypothetical protein [Clostridia bacterium]
YDTDVYQVQDETEGLRTAVAEIVDKYNKRNEEDEKKRLEEEARKAEMRRIEEEEKLRKEEELRLLKADMSPEVAEFVGNGEEEDFGEYDDFSDIGTEGLDVSAAEVKKAEAAAVPSGNMPGAGYLERLESEYEETTAESPVNEEESTDKKAGQSKISKNSRNRKNGERKK